MKLRWLFLILLFAAVAFFVWQRFTKPAPDTKASRSAAVPVIAATVEARDVPIWLTGLGTVQAFNTVTVRPRVGGVLKEVTFTEGQEVKDGEVLAQIDPRPYQAILDQAIAKQAQSAAQSANARTELERVSRLVGSGAESRGRYDELKTNADQFAALEQESIAAVQAAKLDLEFATVRAPISGRTGIRLLDEGNLVTANQEEGLVVITQLRPISVIISLPQGALPLLQQRLRLNSEEVQVEALSDDGRVIAKGSLALIDNQIATESGSVRLKATFPNEDEALWPGQFVLGRVLVETRTGAMVVPTEVIQDGLNGPFAYVIGPDGKVEVRSVQVGPTVEGLAVIDEGLTQGERVVLDGQSKLRSDSTVSIQDRTR